MKKRKSRRKPHYGSVFAPLYPIRISSNRSTDIPPVELGGQQPAPTAESELPKTAARKLHDLRKKFSLFKEDVAKEQEIAPGGPGFYPTSSPGLKGIYDPKISPGLSFRTENGWKLWKAAVELIKRDSRRTVGEIIQLARVQAGVVFGQIQSDDLRVVQMGIQWYANNAGIASGSDGANGAEG